MRGIPEDADELLLHGFAEAFELLEEQGAALRLLNPRATFAALTQEAFAEGLVGAQCAIDTDERGFGGPGRGVKKFGNRGFAGAIFTDEKHQRAHGREFADLGDQLGEFGALPDQTVVDVKVFASDAAAGGSLLGLELPVFEPATQRG